MQFDNHKSFIFFQDVKENLTGEPSCLAFRSALVDNTGAIKHIIFLVDNDAGALDRSHSIRATGQFPETPTVCLYGWLMVKDKDSQPILQRTSVTLVNGTELRNVLVQDIEGNCVNNMHSTLSIRNGFAKREL